MTPDTMEAVLVEREGGPLALGRIPTPRPAWGEVLVRVTASPINPSDLGFIEGSYGGTRNLPAIPGFEGSGVVVGAGSGLLPKIFMGRRVAFASGAGGAWAEYVAVPAMRCIPLPRKYPLEGAATLIVNPLTALAFFDIVREERHAAVVSNAAASALGRMIVRLSRERGVPVINIVRRPEQMDLLRTLGADHVLNSAEDGFPSRLRDLARRLGATLILDAVGGVETHTLVEAAPPRSTILVYAALAGEPSRFNARTLIAEEKRIEGFYLGHWALRKGLWRTIRDVWSVPRLAAGPLQTVVHRRLPLSAAPEAVAAYKSDMTAGKVLLVADREVLAAA